MAHADALYLIGHFRSRASLEPTRVKTRVSRVETFLCFLEALVTRVRTREWKKKAPVVILLFSMNETRNCLHTIKVKNAKKKKKKKKEKKDS